MLKKRIILTFAFFPLFLPSFSFSSVKNVVESSGNTTVINSTETKAEGSNARTESSVSTTVNGKEVTVKTNQPGEVRVEVKNGETKIETSKGITPTIIITGAVNFLVGEIASESEKSQVKMGIETEIKTKTQKILGEIFSPVRNVFRFFWGLFKVKE